MPGIDTGATRPARHAIDDDGLKAGSMTLSELLTGRWTRRSRKANRTRHLAATIEGRDPNADNIPSETILAVAGVCNRTTCCTDGRTNTGACYHIGACGCKIIRHVAHGTPMLRRDDTTEALQRTVRALAGQK